MYTRLVSASTAGFGTKLHCSAALIIQADCGPSSQAHVPAAARLIKYTLYIFIQLVLDIAGWLVHNVSDISISRHCALENKD